MTGYLYLLPNFIGFMIFTWVPIIMCIGMSLTDYDGFGKMNFIGLNNFIKLFSDDNYLISLKNNLLFTVACVPLTIILSLAFALLVDSVGKGSGFFKTCLFFPHITSFVSVAIVWCMMFHPQSGIINTILIQIGVKHPPEWLISSKYALWAIIIVSVWKSCGYYMILMLSGLHSIPKQLYEAAQIDGASSTKRLLFITLPMLTPTLLFVIIILIINSFQVFDIINVMTEGGPGRSTNMLAYRIYLEAYKYFRFGYASAISVILFFINLFITIVLFQSQKKWVIYME